VIIVSSSIGLATAQPLKLSFGCPSVWISCCWSSPTATVDSRDANGFLKETMKHQKQQTTEDDHKKNDGDNKDKEKKLATVEETTPEQKKIQSLLWETFMISYSAYGALLCWATYIAVTQSELRPSLSWAMTGLMAMKLVTTAKVEIDEKFYSLIFFYIPTYGGYAMYKTVAC